MMETGIIYRVTHKESGKVYVGATTQSLNRRKSDHVQKAYKGSGGYFQEAIATYGPEAFEWEQIDTAGNVDELANKERMYVEEYDSKENGYNCDSGGGLKKTVYQYSLEDGILINKFDSLESAGNSIGANKRQISRACLSVNKVFGGFYWSYLYIEPFVPLVDERTNVVIQMDIDENYLQEFCSVSKASYVTGVNRTSIAKVCRGERKQAGGYRWVYKFGK